jgi:AcrR family transcriptional regulator
MDAAGELFAKRGVQQTTVEEIAAAGGVSVGTIYAHFGSKQALALAFMDEALDTLERHLEEVRATKPARDRVLDAGDAYFRFAMEQPVAFRFAAARVLQPDTSGEYDEMNKAIDARVQRIVMGIATDVKAAMTAGDIPKDPIDETMIFLWGLWNGVTNLVLRQDGMSIPPELGHRALQFGRRVLAERAAANRAAERYDATS